MERLADKGVLVRAGKQRWAIVYTPALSRQEYALGPRGHPVRQVIDAVLDGDTHSVVDVRVA